MKTREEENSINRVLSALVVFLNRLAEETDYSYEYDISDYEYDNEKEVIRLLYSNGKSVEVNVHADSVAACMKDTLKNVLFSVY